MLLPLLATSAFFHLTESVDITEREWPKYYSATGAEVRLRSMVPDDENYFVCGTLCLKT